MTERPACACKPGLRSQPVIMHYNNASFLIDRTIIIAVYTRTTEVEMATHLPTCLQRRKKRNIKQIREVNGQH